MSRFLQLIIGASFLVDAPIISLFQSFFQGGGAQLRQVHLMEAIFGGEHEGLGQAVAGDDLALLLRVGEKLPGSGRGGGVVQVEDPDDALVPHRPVVADGQVHLTSPG